MTVRKAPDRGLENTLIISDLSHLANLSLLLALFFIFSPSYRTFTHFILWTVAMRLFQFFKLALLSITPVGILNLIMPAPSRLLSLGGMRERRCKRKD